MIYLTLIEMCLRRFFYKKFCFKLHITLKANTPYLSALAESTLTKVVFTNVKRNPCALAYIFRYFSSNMAKMATFQTKSIVKNDKKVL